RPSPRPAGSSSGPGRPPSTPSPPAIRRGTVRTSRGWISLRLPTPYPPPAPSLAPDNPGALPRAGAGPTRAPFHPTTLVNPTRPCPARLAPGGTVGGSPVPVWLRSIGLGPRIKAGHRRRGWAMAMSGLPGDPRRAGGEPGGGGDDRSGVEPFGRDADAPDVAPDGFRGAKEAWDDLSGTIPYRPPRAAEPPEAPAPRTSSLPTTGRRGDPDR